MRTRALIPLALLGASVAACADSTAPEPTPSTPQIASASVSTGETLSSVRITYPSGSSVTLGAGSSLQMRSMLYYSRGGTLNGVPYVQWSSSNPCVASVSSKYPSFGLVKGLRSGTTTIEARFAGKTDVVTVTVTGGSSSGCSVPTASAPGDPSNGTPSTRYGVRAGEKLVRLVVFNPKSAVRVGQTVRIATELWYSGGGKLNAQWYVRPYSTNNSVATMSGTNLTGRSAGRAMVIAALGQFRDTAFVSVVR